MSSLSTWNSGNYIACTLHTGLVSISFYAIPICPSTIHNFLIYLSPIFFCLLSAVYTQLVIITPFWVTYNTLVRNKEQWWPTRKTRIKHVYSSPLLPNSFSPCIYMHVCISWLWQNETELILSFQFMASSVWHTDFYVYPTFKNLLNRDYCRLCISVCRRGAVTMPAGSARTG